MTMTPALAELLSHPALWRGGDCAPEPAALPTGHPELDAVLPGRGWPSQALAEVLLAREGIGELRLVLPVLARLTRERRQVVWIAPPYRPYAPALAAAGVDLGKLVLVACRDAADALWAFDQALRAPECGAAFAWLAEADERKLHRLAVAAREGRTLGVLWRRPGVTAQAVAAPLRLGLASRDGLLEVRVLKRRGGEVAAPVRLDVAKRWSTLDDDALSPTAFGPRTPNRPLRPDPRTSAGHAQAEGPGTRLRRAAH
jgi:cell division inhibitor SulA